MTDFDNNSPQPIASATWQPCSMYWRKFRLIFNAALFIVIVLVFVLNRQFGFLQSLMDSPFRFTIWTILVAIAGIRANTKSGHHSQCTALHIFNDHILAKWAGANEAEQIKYEHIHFVKQRGKRTLKMNLVTKTDFITAYFYFEDNDAEHFAELIEERRTTVGVTP